ncbi:MAG TPA: class I SAM-dependent methyltransferase [Thermoanaerobaculia bacterium]|nr:class I SAM-dependent methyltransferase [Thermoanaerobaculia bacterium]
MNESTPQEQEITDQNTPAELTYEQRVVSEAKKWGQHLHVEASGEWNAWLDHPLINDHYDERSLIDGLRWEKWVRTAIGRPAECSLDLGCGSGSRSFSVFRAGSSSRVEGADLSADRIEEAERMRQASGMPGAFRVEDSNISVLPRNRYDLIFSAHSFHHFLELEHVMGEVSRALTDRGLFVLEEFTGPTQFQWTDAQLSFVNAILGALPENFRELPHGRVWAPGTLKTHEARPAVEDVVAASPFESIRSADIVPLFEQFFEIVEIRRLGGTIQHLLYNGIMHNFRPEVPGAAEIIQGICQIEDGLIDSGLLPSDFMLLIGRPRR